MSTLEPIAVTMTEAARLLGVKADRDIRYSEED